MGGVVGEVVRVGGGAGGVFELAVDGFGGFVAGGGLVEVGVDVAGWLVEGGARLAQLARGGGNAFFEGVDGGGYRLLALGGVGVGVGVGVGRDRLLRDVPGGLDLDVVLVGEECVEVFSLLVGDQVLTGVQGAARFVQGVVLVAAVAVELLLDAASALVQGLGVQADHVEGVKHRGGLGTSPGWWRSSTR